MNVYRRPGWGLLSLSDTKYYYYDEMVKPRQLLTDINHENNAVQMLHFCLFVSTTQTSHSYNSKVQYRQ